MSANDLFCVDKRRGVGIGTYSMQFVRSTPFCSMGNTGTPIWLDNFEAPFQSFSVNGANASSFIIFHLGAEQKKPVWFTAQVDTSFNAELTSKLRCLLI
jgi:hypothetical protein